MNQYLPIPLSAVCSALVLFFSFPASAAQPEVSFVLSGPEQWWMRPDAGNRPSLIVGEALDVPGVEVWLWAPPSKEEDIKSSAPKVGWTTPSLPVEPPQGSRKALILDIERQVLVVDLGRQPGTILWVKSENGISDPYLFNVAGELGFWIMDEEVPRGGTTFGYGLGEHLRLVGENGSFEPKVVAGRHSLVHFEIAEDAPLGEYRLYTHNGQGGVFGWQEVGELRVAEKPAERMVFQVDEFGAKGDGRSNDYPALLAAMDAAAKAGGGDVFLPPGTYLVDNTLEIPEGVALRGAARENTVIRSLVPLQWLVRLGSSTGLENLTLADGPGVEGFRGLVGGGGEDMSVINCELKPRGSYSMLIASPQARRFRLINSTLHGPMRIFWHGVNRAEIVGNTILRGGFGGRPISESVFASNIVRDAPGRNAFDSNRRSLFELNEVHGFWRAPFPQHNWEEAMMSHGAGDKIIGHPSQSSAESLQDGTQSWKPGEHRGKWVLIMEGRGFGQYRLVLDNTEDTLILEKPWRVLPDKTSRYALGIYYAENIHLHNLIQGWGVYVLWLDQINNRVKGLHTLSAGMVLWAREGTHTDDDGKLQSAGAFNPAWYNVISSASLEGGSISIDASEAASSPYNGPVLFGNVISNNRITAPHLRRLSHVRGMEQRTHYQESPLISTHAGISLMDLKFKTTPGTKRRATHTIIAGNYIIDAPVAIEVDDLAGKTFILNNQYQFVQRPLVAGEETRRWIHSSGNLQFEITDDGLQRRELPEMIIESEPEER